MGAYLLDGNTRCPLSEVGIKESYEWQNPDEVPGRPDEFCISRIESDYWQIQFRGPQIFIQRSRLRNQAAFYLHCFVKSSFVFLYSRRFHFVIVDNVVQKNMHFFLDMRCALGVSFKRCLGGIIDE